MLNGAYSSWTFICHLPKKMARALLFSLNETDSTMHVDFFAPSCLIFYFIKYSYGLIPNLFKIAQMLLKKCYVYAQL